MKSTKWFALIVMSVVLGGYVFAGGQSETKQTSDDNAAPTGTLKIWSTLSQKERATELEKLAKDYEVQHPGVTAEITVMPWGGAMDKIMAALMAGNPPDISVVGQGWPQTLAGTGGLVELSDLVNQIGGKDAFLGTSLSVLGSSEGKVYSVPLYVTPYVMYYRKSWMKEAGISKLPTTWEEYYELCKAVTKPEENRYGFGLPLGDIHAGKTIWSFLLSNGVTLINQDKNGKWVVDVDKKAAVEVYNYLYKLVKDTAPAGVVSYTQSNVREMVGKGIIMSRVDTPEIYYNVKAMDPESMNDVSYFRMIPRKATGSGMGFVGLSLYNEGNVALAKDFVKYLYTGDTMKDFYLSYPYAMFPAKKDMFASPAYAAGLPEELKPFVPKMALDILSTSAGLGMWNGSFPGAGEIESRNLMGNALSNMLIKGISAEQAVDQLANDLKALLD